MAYAYDSGAGGGGTTHFTATLGGSLSRTQADKYRTNPYVASTMEVSLNGVNSVTIKNSDRNGKTFYIYAINIVFDGETVHSANVYTFSANGNTRLITHTGKKVSYNGTYTYNFSLNKTKTFNSTGSKYFQVIVKYSETEKYSAYSATPTYTLSSETVFVYSPSVYVNDVTFNDIYLKAYPTKLKYLLGQTFDRSGISIYANKRLYVAGNVVQGEDYDVTTLCSYSSVDTSSAGTKSQSVSYSGKTISYSKINVYGVSDKTYELAVVDSYVKKNSAIPIITTTFNYGDGSSSTEPVTISGLDTSKVGTQTVTYSATASKTGEKKTWTSSVTVHDYSLYVTTNVTHLSYNANVSPSNFVVQKDYGTTSIAKETISSSNLTAAKGSWKVGIDTGEVIITEKSTGKTASYKLNVDGLYEMSVNYDESKCRVPLHGVFASPVNSVSVRRYNNGVLGNNETWSGAISQSDIDTNTVGTTDVAFSITENGVTLSDTKTITIYKFDSIEITNQTTTFIKKDVSPTLTIGTVKAKTSDNKEVILTYGATNNGYTTSPAVGSQLPLGITTVTLTPTLGSSISFDVVCEENHPADDATLIISGSLDKSIYQKGETVDLKGLKVMVSKMAGGETNYEITDYQAVIKGTNSLKIPDNAESGYYDITISYGELESVDISDAFLVDGVDSVSCSLSKLVYKAGETFDINTISGTITYLSGDEIPILPIDITNYPSTEFSADDAGEYEIQFDVAGITITKTITIVKLVSITVINAKVNYNIHDALDVDKVSVKKVYSDGGEEPYTGNDLVFTFTGGTGCSENDLIPPNNRESAVVGVNVELTEGGVSVDADFNISVKALRSVKLLNKSTTEIIKIAYEYGEYLRDRLVGNIVYATFNDNTTDQITIDESFNACSPLLGERIASSSSQSGSVFYTFARETKSANFTIHCHYLSDITVDFDSLDEEEHYINDQLVLDEITGTRTIASTDISDTNYPQEGEDITDDLTFTFNGQNIENKIIVLPSEEGTYSVVARYELNGQVITKSKSIEVLDIELESIEVTAAPSKDLDSYIENMRLNLYGLTVTANYNRSGSTRDLQYTDSDLEIVDIDGNQFSKTKQLRLADNGTEIFAKFEDKLVSIGTISVIARQLDSIEVINNPNKTTFTYGDKFVVTGIVVKATYTNGEEESAPLSALTFSGVTLNHEFTPSSDATFGTKTVTVSYTVGAITKTTTFNITLAKPKIKRLVTNAEDPNSPVVKQFKDGDTFNITGLVVTAVMENDWTYEINTYTHNANTVLNLNVSGEIQLTNNYGFKDITIEATNPFDGTDSASCTYTVEIVTSGEVINASKIFSGNYNQYVVGEVFNAKGLYFLVTDIDGNTWQAAPTSTSIAIGTVFRSAQRIKVTCEYATSTNVFSYDVEIIVSVKNKIELTEKNNYKLAIGLADGTLFESMLDPDGNEIKLGKQEGGEFYPLFKEDLIDIDNNPLHTDTYGYNVYLGGNISADCIGYIDLGVDEVRNAHVVLFDDPVNPIDGDGNIEVTFPHYVEGYAERIKNCHFGVIYNNRLFLSGNPNQKNFDWHTSETNNEDNQFTYFSDLDYCAYGSDNTAVVGYDQFRDGDLIVVKEGSRDEATLYRRETKLVSATNSVGDQVGEGLVEEAYPCYPVNSNGGEGGLSNRSIVNFIGETLILTRSGLKAITSKDDVYNTSKYAYDVSTYINTRITKEELENAHLFAFKETLLLKTNRGIYVGYYSLRNESNEYEWYFLNNIQADLFFELNNELYFGNDEGKIYRFPREITEYKDKPRTFIGVGGTLLTIDEVANTIVASADYKDEIVEGRSFHLITNYTVAGADIKSQVHASLGNFVNIFTRQNALEHGSAFDQTAYMGIIDGDNDTIEIKPYTANGEVDIDKLNNYKDLFYNGREIYFDNLVGGGIQASADNKYHLEEVGDNLYKVYDEFGNLVSLQGIEYVRISFVVNDLAITKITEVTDFGTSGAKQFKLIGDHDKILDLIYYNGRTTATYSGVITSEEKVEAYFITAPYSMGSLVSAKTIWMWSIINDTNLASRMDVGYLSSRKQGDFDMTIKSASGARQLNFEGLNFNTIQFLNDGLPHIYTKNRTVANVGVIRFIFKNFEDTNIVLTSLSIVYSLSQLLKGAR